MVELVPLALDGERVDRVVALLTGRSRAEAAALVEAGSVHLDDRPVQVRSTRVVAGQALAVDAGPGRPAAAVAPDEELARRLVVVHADDDVVVVDKPPGLVVHPGAGNPAGTLVHALLARFPELAGVGAPDRPGIVHRLDKDTSGLLVVARSARAYGHLVAELQARRVTRQYDALVWGHFEAPHGVVDAPVGRSARAPTRMAVSTRGREARTHYDVVADWAVPEVSRLCCRLETGRTHQIRVHLAAIGHPVAGDRRYGGDRQGLTLPRPFLHAATLAFTHPASGLAMRFDAPLPVDLAAVVDRLDATGTG